MSHPPIYIPTYNRPDKIAGHPLCQPEADWHLVVHSEEQKDIYQDHGVDTARILVSRTEPGGYGAWHQRKWIIDRAERGKWIVVGDDDLRALHAIAPEDRIEKSRLSVQDGRGYAYWQARFDRPIDLSEVADLICEQIEQAEQVGANLIGWANYKNAYFRGKRWQTAGLAPGNMFLIRPGYLPWSQPNHLEDWWITCAHLLRDGVVLIDQWARVDNERQTDGGYGRRTPERIRLQREGAERILHEFPGLVYLRKNEARDVVLRYHKRDLIDRWRRGLAG